MHLFCSFYPVFSCKMATFLQFTILQTTMAPPVRRGIAAKLPKPTASRRSHILLCGSCPCAFTPSKLKNRIIMDGVSWVKVRSPSFLRCSTPPDLPFCALRWPTGSWCPLKGVGKGERRCLEGTRLVLISIVGKPRLSQITAI